MSVFHCRLSVNCVCVGVSPGRQRAPWRMWLRCHWCRWRGWCRSEPHTLCWEHWTGRRRDTSLEWWTTCETKTQLTLTNTLKLQAKKQQQQPPHTHSPVQHQQQYECRQVGWRDVRFLLETQEDDDDDDTWDDIITLKHTSKNTTESNLILKDTQ